MFNLLFTQRRQTQIKPTQPILISNSQQCVFEDIKRIIDMFVLGR